MTPRPLLIGAGVQFQTPEWLGWLWVVPILTLLALWSIRCRRRALARVADPTLHQLIHARINPARRAAAWLSLLVSVALVVVAAARPQHSPRPREVTRQGRDVVFLVDVSRSMLARDLAPSRLERSKIWVRDLAGSIEGDRVALVAFAGAAVLKCPLTLDYGFFALALDELSPDSVPVGGTNIGDAIRKVMSDVFGVDPDAQTSHRDIILITDGEDQDSLPIEAAAEAGRRGVRVIAIGLGSDQAGATIPVEDRAGREQVLTHEGHTVQSRQDSRQLAQIASASADGVYLNVGTGTIDLDRVYADLIRSAARSTTAESTAIRYDEAFQFLLMPAILLLVFEGVLRERS